MRSLGYYRTLEDLGRRDPDEGDARLRVLGVNENWVSFSGSYFNPVFILCFHGPTADLTLVQRTDQFAVRLVDPNQFARDVSIHLESHPPAGRAATWLDCAKVGYTKDEQSELTPDSRERLRLMYAQKAPLSSHQEEYRVVVGLEGSLVGCPDSVQVNLRRDLPYFEPLY